MRSDPEESHYEADSGISGAKSPFLQRQVEQLYERAPVGLCATGLNALIVVLVQWGVVSHTSLLAWLFCQWLLVLTRYLFFRRFQTITLSPPKAEHWRNRFILGATLSGLLWGSSAIVVFPAESMVHQLFLAFVLGGMVAGAAGSYAGTMPAFLGYSVPALIPIMIRFLVSGELVGVAMGGMVFLFGALMVWTAAKNHGIITTSLRRQFENTNLITSLVAEKQRGEKLNEELAAEIIEREQAEQGLLEHRNHLEELVADRAQKLIVVNEQLEAEIAERILVEKRIARVAGEWTATFDTMSDCISIIDGDFKFVRVNKALAKLLSMEPKDLIGKFCYEQVHGLKEPWPGCPHLKSINENRTVTEEVNDPNVGCPLLVTCSPFHDESGAVVGTVHTARDISEQKRAEQTREQLIAELQEAMANVKLLSGFLPICASCKKIRDDKGYWTQIEAYIRDHSEAEFSHGICPGCAKELYPEFFDTEEDEEPK